MKHIYDHTEPNWSLRYNTHKRENGAATYSRDLVKYQVPLWNYDDLVLSTCPLLRSVENLPEKTDLVVQYLHTYPYTSPLNEIRRIKQDTPVKYRKIVFVTAYNSFHHVMSQAGIDSLFIPMTIDAKAVRKKRIIGNSTKPNAVIYFGNVMPEKETVYKRLKHTFLNAGWTFDTLSHNRFNGLPVGDTDVHKIVQSYDYGIGVGRCALEMMSLGLKVMIAGIEFGGIMVNDADFQAQTFTNMNGRITTFDRSISRCIECFSDALVKTNDIHELLPQIKSRIDGYLKTI